MKSKWLIAVAAAACLTVALIAYGALSARCGASLVADDIRLELPKGLSSAYLSVSENGTRLAVLGYRGEGRKPIVLVMDAATGKVARALELGNVGCLSVSPDGSTIAVSHGSSWVPDGRISLFDARSGKRLWERPASRQQGYCKFTDDGKYVTADCGVLRTSDGKVLSSKPPVAVSHDSTLAAYTSREGAGYRVKVIRFDRTGQPVADLGNSGKWNNCPKICFGFGGKRLVCEDVCHVTMYSLPDGAAARSFDVADGGIVCNMCAIADREALLVWSPPERVRRNGTTTARSPSVQVWDYSTGGQLARTELPITETWKFGGFSNRGARIWLFDWPKSRVRCYRVVLSDA